MILIALTKEEIQEIHDELIRELKEEESRATDHLKETMIRSEMSGVTTMTIRLLEKIRGEIGR